MRPEIRDVAALFLINAMLKYFGLMVLSMSIDSQFGGVWGWITLGAGLYFRGWTK